MSALLGHKSKMRKTECTVLIFKSNKMAEIVIKMNSHNHDISMSGNLNVPMTIELIEMLTVAVMAKTTVNYEKNYIRQDIISAVNKANDFSVSTNNHLPLVRL